MRISSRSLSIAQDLLGVLALIVISIGLGLYSRAGLQTTPAKEGTNEGSAPGGVAHPVFNLTEFRRYIDAAGGIVLDARSAAEYSVGHVPTAISLPQADFDNAYDRLRDRLEPFKDRVIVVYCSDLWCGLADEVQQRLVDRGFRHVACYPDGWQGWSNSGLPVEKQP